MILALLRSSAVILPALQTALSPNPPLQNLVAAQPTSVVWISAAATTAAPAQQTVVNTVASSSSSSQSEDATILIVVVLLIVILVTGAVVAVYNRGTTRKSGDADVTLVNPAFVNFGTLQPNGGLYDTVEEKRPKFVALSALELEAACSVALLPPNVPKNGMTNVLP